GRGSADCATRSKLSVGRTSRPLVGPALRSEVCRPRPPCARCWRTRTDANLGHMSMKAAVLLLIGLLTVAGGISLMVVVSGPQAKPLPINDLAQMVKYGQIASIDVDGNNAVAHTRQSQSFALHLDNPGSLPQLLQSFGVTPEQLSQVNYVVANPPPYGLIAPVLGALLPLLLLVGVGGFALLRGLFRPNEMLNFGKTRARVFDTDRPRIT